MNSGPSSGPLLDGSVFDEGGRDAAGPVGKPLAESGKAVEVPLPVAQLPQFDDGKDADAFRTIGEVAQALGIRQHVLRYWEEQVPSLRPLKRSGGRRYYRPEDVAIVRLIDQLVHRQGYTLRGARQAIAAGMKAPPPAPAVEPGTLPATMPEEPRATARYLAELLAIRAELAAALRSS